MKTIIISAFIALFALSCSKGPVQTASYKVVPLPAEISLRNDSMGFTLDSSTRIVCNDTTLRKEAVMLQEFIEQQTGLTLKITSDDDSRNSIELRADGTGQNPEGYQLTVDQSNISIIGNSPAGTFYGIQTLRKSIPAKVRGAVLFPAVTIIDQPRFAYRGAMLDVSRHFFPVDTVKAFIDMIALHNINRLHWHLSDDQGWRVEIKSHPRLVEVGSKRPGTVIGHNTPYYDTIPVEGYYTQLQLKDIIDYAADRHITIIPEIDLPGHMMAALTAYPELGCTGGPYEVWRKWGVSEDLLCAGNDSTIAFIEDVLGEVADIFPSEYIHIGGDECPKVRWEQCPKCQARIKQLGLKSDSHSTKEQKLQSHVMNHAAQFLASKGKRTIGWDEILEGGAAKEAIVMSWRGEEGGIEAAKLGHDVIMAPNTYFYFDYYQTLDQADEPESIGGFIPLELVYSYEPITDRYTPEEAEHIIGIQANLWTEYIKTFSHAQYNELPRMAALAEVQWSNAPKDYKKFLERAKQLMALYASLGYTYSTRAFDIEETIDVDSDNHRLVVTLSTPDSCSVFYTTDGTMPTKDSRLYTDPISLTESTVLKAVAIRADGPGRLLNDTISFNKATGRPITLKHEPEHRYRGNGAQSLVDGKHGGRGYNSGGWIGFSPDDPIATIDLGSPVQVSEVGVNTCIDTGTWVFDARSMSVELSDDGQSWTLVASEDYPQMESPYNGVINHTLKFEPHTARFVRVSLAIEKDMPQWHSDKGNIGFVFIDEIVVN